MTRQRHILITWLLVALASSMAVAQRPARHAVQDEGRGQHQHRDRSFAPAPADPVVTSGSGWLRVKVSHDLRHLSRRIEQLSRVSTIDGESYHVRVERQSHGLIALYHSTGDRIATGFDERSPGPLLQAIARLARARALIDLSTPRQHFDLSLELSGSRGLLSGDQRFDITAHTDRPAVLLLLNVDETGNVSVLYPIHDRELQPAAGLHETFEAVPPYGTEYLKLFAFRRPPAGLDEWLHRRIDALAPDFDRFLRLLREPGVDSAQARLEVVTVEEPLSDGRRNQP